MSEVKWIKIAIGMPDDEKIKLIDALENRDLTHYVLLRLLIQAGKKNAKGRIFLSETIPYTYVKKVSGKAVKMSVDDINDAVSIHGAVNVKLAIDRAVKVKKVRMNYINGILKNWQLEGYPVSDSNYDNSYKVQGRKLSFINFEPRKYDYDALEKALLGWKE